MIRISKNKYIKSPLNYTGGKYKLLPQIMPLIPNNIDTFVDLFGGGFNLGINADAEKIIYNEINSYLVALFQEFDRKTVDFIINHINKRIKEYGLSKTNEIGFYEFRKYYNKTKNPLDLYVLTCFSFNYQIRFNNKHEYNNPFGKNRSSFNPSLKNRLIKFINTLQSKNIEFCNNNFNDFNYSMSGKDDFVYCDPPYLITNATYNRKNGFKGWTEKEELDLLNILDNLNNKKIKFALSNVLKHKGKTNRILLEWSKKYNINYLNYSYSNCNYRTKDKSRNSSTEVLITNYDLFF